MTETLAHGYSYESTQQDLSNENQHDRVYMLFKKALHRCVLDESSLCIVRVNSVESLRVAKPALLDRCALGAVPRLWSDTGERRRGRQTPDDIWWHLGCIREVSSM